MSCVPLVSILIPAYNAERTLSATIESAFAQTWPHKEIIVVDDGSTDATAAVARQYEAECCVRVLSQANRGASAARNAAFSLARGDFIQWLDADDILDTQKIALQMQVGNPAHDPWVLLTSAWGTFYHCKTRARFVADDLWEERLEPVEWLLRKFRKNLWMNPAVWLVGRPLAEAAGPWDERLVRDNDGEYLTRLVAKSRGVRFVRPARAYYRIGDLGSLSNRDSRAAMESRVLSVRLCTDHLLGIEDSEGTRKAALEFLRRRATLWRRHFGEVPGEAVAWARSMGWDLELGSSAKTYWCLARVSGTPGTVARIAGGLRMLVRSAPILIRREYDRFLNRALGVI
jgi:glycosyltransferase involved in cell wall biosynthesis